MSHTPGPWKLCYHLESAENDAQCTCGYRGAIRGGDGASVICEIGVGIPAGEEGLSPTRYSRPAELSNARLIAAAPELLEQLKSVLSCIELVGETLGDMDAMRAAIAKAEGHV